MSFAALMFFMKNGYKDIKFYMNGEQCNCIFCRKCVLRWDALEDYADKGVQILMGDLIDEDLVEAMKVISYCALDKYRHLIFPRDPEMSELCNWYLGLYNEEHFNMLSDDMKEVCRDFSEGCPVVNNEAIAAYIFEAHIGYSAGKTDERSFCDY